MPVVYRSDSTQAAQHMHAGAAVHCLSRCAWRRVLDRASVRFLHPQILLTHFLSLLRISAAAKVLHRQCQCVVLCGELR